MAKRPLKAVSTTEALAISLRQRILSGELAPGVALPEVALAAEYGVARPTIRAALQQLTTSGLVQREPNRSAIIPRLSAADHLDLYRARELLESEIVRRLANRRLVPEAAAQALEQLEALADTADFSSAIEADLDVHRALAEGVESPRLARLYGLLEDEIRLSSVQLRAPYESPASLARDLREVARLITAGSTEAAIAAMRDHVAPVRQADHAGASA